MEINYLVKESVEHSVEIENKNFCFFEGTDGCGFSIWFGVWQDGSTPTLNVVTIETGRVIFEKFAITGKIENRIGNFLSEHPYVKSCSSENFFELYKKVTAMFLPEHI